MFKKVVITLLVLGFFSGLVGYGYPMFDRYMKAHLYQIDYYTYKPSRNVLAAETEQIPTDTPATAVPILLYHGVTYKKDSGNTYIDNFVRQMEMLKTNGYRTISLDEFYDFLNGSGSLPPKPIIITFDDGRKDSFYTTDDVLKKLGYKAVIFLVSGKPNDNDKFYLSWNELKKMYESGRWDIQAHGTYSHNIIPVDDQGNTGRFLYSREFLTENRELEPIDLYEKRVEKDYLDNISDIEKHLGYTPYYYAVPLNYFGTRIKTNYDGSEEYNNTIKSKYFRLSFVETYADDDDIQDVTRLPGEVNNFADADRLHIARIEVKNMSAAKLKDLLEYNYPAKPEFSFGGTGKSSPLDDAKSYYGNFFIESDGLKMTTARGEDTAQIVFGKEHWKDYTAEVELASLEGNSATVIVNMKDGNNYISYGLSDGYLIVRETVSGVSTNLKPPIFAGSRVDKPVKLKVVSDGDNSDFYYNDRLYYKDVPVQNTKGFSGIKVWGKDGKAGVSIKNFEVK